MVRVFDPHITDWDRSVPEYYEHIDQGRFDTMLDRGVAELVDADAPEAWRQLFPYVRSASEDRVFVKTNFNTDAEPTVVNTTGQAICSVLRGLVEHCGFSASNIVVCDPSRSFIGVIRTYCEERYPDVQYLNRNDVTYPELAVSKFVFPPEVFIEQPEADRETTVPQVLLDSDHLVNLHLMKAHWGVVTGAMKNLFGLARNVYDTYHGGGAGGWGEWEFSPHVARLVSQPQIVERSRLLISEAIFTTDIGAADPPGRPKRPQLYRVRDVEQGEVDPRCVFVSTNPVCHDSVLASSYEPGVSCSDSRLDWLKFADRSWGNTAGYHDLGTFEIGALVEGEFTEEDLSFNRIDYRSVHI